MRTPARRHEAGEIPSPDGTLSDHHHFNPLRRSCSSSLSNHFDAALIPYYAFNFA